MAKRILMTLGILALPVGIGGIYLRLAHGHADAGYGSYVVWGLWVAMYLFFAGCAAGSYMVSTLDLLIGVKVFKGTGRVALWCSMVCLAAALLFIWLDLGHLERVWKIYLEGNPGSVMWQMVWGYTSFGILTLLSLWLALTHPHSAWLKVTLLLGLLAAFFVSAAVGALLGVQGARPFWHVGLFPVQFPVFSLASGVALLMIVFGWFWPRTTPNNEQRMWILGITSVLLLLIKLYFMWADYSQSIYGKIPMNVQAVHEVLFGPNWWAFWILQIVMGSLIPIFFLVQPRYARNPIWSGWMGLLLLVGYAVARGLIIFPALTIPEISELAEAFDGPRLRFEYFPTGMEWSVMVGIIGLAPVACLIGNDRLPLFKRENEGGA